MIAIMLLSLLVYLFSNMADSTSGIYDNLESSELTEFNQQFLNYEGRGITPDPVDGKMHYLTIQDVVTLINLAKDNERTGKMNTSITIYVKGLVGGFDSSWMNEQQERLLMENSDKFFTCGYNSGSSDEKGVYINIDTKLVEKVYVEEVNI